MQHARCKVQHESTLDFMRTPCKLQRTHNAMCDDAVYLNRLHTLPFRVVQRRQRVIHCPHLRTQQVTHTIQSTTDVQRSLGAVPPTFAGASSPPRPRASVVCDVCSPIARPSRLQAAPVARPSAPCARPLAESLGSIGKVSFSALNGARAAARCSVGRSVSLASACACAEERPCVWLSAMWATV
jgi:hypothetical protein